MSNEILDKHGITANLNKEFGGFMSDAFNEGDLSPSEIEDMYIGFMAGTRYMYTLMSRLYTQDNDIGKSKHIRIVEKVEEYIEEQFLEVVEGVGKIIEHQFKNEEEDN